MRLNDNLIASFEYRGKEYSIDLSFDNVLDVFDALADKELRDIEKIDICLELLLDESVEEDIVELWNYIYDEFIMIKVNKPIEYDLKGNPMPTMEEDEEGSFIDLEQDAEYIYTSFIQAYNINLYKEHGKLHWHEFKALLNGLPSNTIMQRIIQIRMWKPSKHEPAEYKESMKKLQKIYTLEELEQYPSLC